MKKIILTLVILFLGLFANSQTSKESGGWNEPNVWVDNNTPGYDFGNNTTITISSGNVVVCDNNLNFNNNATINIYGTLIINGNITVHNNLKINVYNNGVLDITGTLTLNNNGTLDIDGELDAGNIVGGNNNNLTGNGTITIHDENFDCDNVFENCENNNVVIITNPLPIELLFFNAKQHNNNIIIEWSTASETNNNYFVLERSNNTVLWETINITQSQGTTSQTTYYNYVDNNPFTNLNYYRLTQHDFDGKFETFNIIVVEYNNINNKPYNTIYYNMFGNIINNIETYSKAYIVVYFDGNNNIIKTEKRLNN